jgi:Holliday junction resolvase
LSGRAPRDKGNRLEREIINLHEELDIHAERYPLSGASHFRGSGHDIDVYADDDAFAPLTAEVKGRKNGEGFAQLEKWLGAYDLLFLRRDRKKPMVVMPWRVYTYLMGVEDSWQPAVRKTQPDSISEKQDMPDGPEERSADG